MLRKSVLLVLVFITQSLIAADEQVTVTAPRIDSPTEGTFIEGPSIRNGIGPVKGPEIEAPTDASGTGMTTAQKLAYWGRTLVDLIQRLRPVFAAFGKVKFDCKAEAVCQSDEVLGARCNVRGLYLTADEAYHAFSHADCCALEGKGRQIGVEFGGCATF